MKEKAYAWEFRPRFRKGAFGWKSQPPMVRIKEAIVEIKKMAKSDPVLAAEGAVLFLEKVSAALENVDSSSGAIGSAVNKAVEELCKVIGAAPAPPAVRSAWMDRLWRAQQEDTMPYIEHLGDCWGIACGSPEVASKWADFFLGGTRAFLSSRQGGYFQGTTNCLSSLLAAGRHQELLELLERTPDYLDPGHWRTQALFASGQNDDDSEEGLLKQGRVEEAYRRFGLVNHQKSTNLATFRAVKKQYPSISPQQILQDLVDQNPEAAGKWFAAAKDAGLWELALDLAARSACDPKTLARAARDFEEKNPEFALGAALLSLHWLVEGYGYDITGLDIWGPYTSALKVGASLGREAEVKGQIEVLLARAHPNTLVRKTLKGR
ncbi:hypothetical protein ABS71_08165 [bacterium SCN 62-11]|nr:MAG: hypothetical protein ABS71_08165 [bacterium SCN 62-11]